MYSKTWNPPYYHAVEKPIFIPRESEIETLIKATGPKTSVFLQCLKETGARAGEIQQLKWNDIDLEQAILRITPEKRSKARVLKVSQGLMLRLAYVKKINRVYDQSRIFSIRYKSILRIYQKQRKRIAREMQNNRLLRIKFHTLRHWHATNLYHKTKDIMFVQRRLGHRSITNTLKYIHLAETYFGDQESEYDVKVAETKEQAIPLIEQGYEEMSDFNGAKIYRCAHAHHRMPLQMGTTFWRSADKKASDAIKKTTTTKRFIVRDEVRAVIELSKNYESVAYLLGFQCGLLPSDITNLTWDKIAIDFDNNERDFVHVENTREKTGATHIFVITPDILHFLKNVWLEQGKPTEGYIFTGNTGNKMLKRNLPKLFKKRAIASLGETRGASLKFKDLRDAFNENLLDCNITAEVKDTLMGHLRESAKSSYSLAIASVVRIYREKVFPSIAVNGWTLKQQAKGYSELKLALKQLETENIAYKKRIDGLHERIDRMEHNFNNIMVTIMNELELYSLMVPKLDSE
jgi:integrase